MLKHIVFVRPSLGDKSTSVMKSISFLLRSRHKRGHMFGVFSQDSARATSCARAILEESCVPSKIIDIPEDANVAEILAAVNFDDDVLDFAVAVVHLEQIFNLLCNFIAQGYVARKKIAHVGKGEAFVVVPESKKIYILADGI